LVEQASISSATLGITSQHLAVLQRNLLCSTISVKITSHMILLLLAFNAVSVPVSVCNIKNNNFPALAMSSIDDIINLIKQTDSSRADERARDKEVLATERAQDKRERAEEISSLTQTISGLIKNGVKEEVESAIKPIKPCRRTEQTCSNCNHPSGTIGRLKSWKPA
jgi:hypothetical protein